MSKDSEGLLCTPPTELAKNEHPEDLSTEMIGTCEAMLDVFKMIRKVANTDVPVLVTGASGTGKEMVARAIHQRSVRHKGPFVAINCSAIPRELLESELFGHEKGSFTGAYRTSIGMVERANLGTLFLDEVGELPLDMQAKFLRFLQEHTFERVGGRKTIKVDLRVISATNCDLRELIAADRFREDLYYRLDVINIELPHLKDRGDDALIIANTFLKQYAAKHGKNIKGFAPEAIAAIETHSWPGNIRELVNRIRRAVVMAEGEWITPENMSLTVKEITPESIIDGLGLKEAKERFEMSLVAAALKRNQGNVSLAAKALKTSRSVVYNLIQKYGLKQDMPDRLISGKLISFT
jgi:two-component system NtrC family response regulator